MLSPFTICVLTNDNYIHVCLHVFMKFLTNVYMMNILHSICIWQCGNENVKGTIQ